MINNQSYLFLIFIVDGIIIGILFDFFRILRKSFNSKDITTNIEDFIFWILTGILVLYTVFVFNNGEIRLYMFLAITLGIIMYMFLFSKHIIKINVFIISIAKRFVSKVFSILTIPIKKIYILICKIFLKPVYFLFINTRKISTNLYKFSSKFPNKIKN